ncbi:hypothetical protein PAEPH01_2485 [Pancytospora epiphaga]|nr:hypothetical protein PAEPH01_2485 [Pancytospora epiphaga]
MEGLSKQNFESIAAIRDLTSEEIQALLPRLNEQQKSDLSVCLEQLNEELNDKIRKRQEEVRKSKKINSILLHRVWRNINPCDKKKCAPFFNDLENEFLD